MASDLGTVTKVDEGYELRFERHFEQPVEEVWQAITEPEHLAEWIGGSEVDLQPGGRIKIAEGGGAGIDGEVLTVEPERVFAFKWDSKEWGDGGRVQFELAPDADGGTLLVFTHIHPEANFEEYRSKTLAGWHYLLSLLDGALLGRPEKFSMDAWHRVHGRYAGDTVYA